RPLENIKNRKEPFGETGHSYVAFPTLLFTNYSHPSDHDHHRHERRSNEYHHTSARLRTREARHNHQGAFEVPASQPEKADYVHTWLQRSQANRACSPEPVPGDRPRKVSPRAHMVKQTSQKKKRARSESPELVHPRETHSPNALRFEKKSRHNTRLDKYEYRPEVDRHKRRTQTTEHRREDSHGSLEDVKRHTRSKYQHAQRMNEHAQRTDHGTARRQSSKAREVETISRRPDHRSRAVEPGRRSRRQQAEAKEMKELSAFFTGRADGEKAEAEKIHYRPHREQRYDTATARHPASDIRQQRTHDSPSPSLLPSRSTGSTRQPSPASLRPDSLFSSRGDDSILVLPNRPSSRSTTYFTWSTSDRDPAPVSNVSISEKPRKSIQSSARKLVLQEREIKGPHVVSEDFKIRPASRAKRHPRKSIVYQDAQVQTSFDADRNQNRQYPKNSIPQYQDSAVMTADENSNLKQRVSMLPAEALPTMDKRTVYEQPSSNTTATTLLDVPPQPQFQPQPQAWVTSNARDRLFSQPFVAARNLFAQEGWQTYQEPSPKQASGRYTKLVPPERVRALIKFQGLFHVLQLSFCMLIRRIRLVKVWKITSAESSKKLCRVPPTTKKWMDHSPMVQT
ncbi:hypothetical protein GE21DRAFT_1339394, partial [Neurospora crassa]